MKQHIALSTIIVISALFFAGCGENPKLDRFSSLNIDSNKNDTLSVLMAEDAKVVENPASGNMSFFVLDGDGTKMRVLAPMNLDSIFVFKKRVKIIGHLHEEYFHASEILQDE